MSPKSHSSLLAYMNIRKELLLICIREKAKIALFSELSNFYFDLTLFDIGGMMAPQNVFDHRAQTLRRGKLKLGDF